VTTLSEFVAFLHAKFRTTRGPGDPFYDGHDIEYSDSLLYHGSPDTDGSYSTAIDYTALLEKIDAFAAEFAASKFDGIKSAK
jgi:hypothetical protein